MPENILKSTKYLKKENFGGNFVLNDGVNRVSALGIAAKIIYFIKHENNARSDFLNDKEKHPLIMKNAYVCLSICLCSIVRKCNNVISKLNDHRLWNPDMHHISLNLDRTGCIRDNPFPSKHGSIKIDKKCGILSFVSCGYKQINRFPFAKFITAFDSRVRTWIFITIVHYISAHSI